MTGDPLRPRGNARRRRQLPPTSDIAKEALNLDQEGHHDRAISLLREHLDHPRLPAGPAADLRLALARVLLNSKRPKAAVAEMVEILRVDAHRPDALLLLAEALLECNEFSRAHDIIQRAQRSGAESSRLRALELRLNNNPDEDALTPALDRTAPPNVRRNLVKDHPPQPSLSDEDALTPAISSPRSAANFVDEDALTPAFQSGIEDPPPMFFDDNEDTIIVESPNHDLDDPEDTIIIDEGSVDFQNEPEPTRPPNPDPPVLLFGDDEETMPWLSDRNALDSVETSPRGWSVGDPSASSIASKNDQPLIFFDEDTQTGSFKEISSDILDQAEQVEQNRHNQTHLGTNSFGVARDSHRRHADIPLSEMATAQTKPEFSIGLKSAPLPPRQRSLNIVSRPSSPTAQEPRTVPPPSSPPKSGGDAVVKPHPRPQRPPAHHERPRKKESNPTGARPPAHARNLRPERPSAVPPPIPALLAQGHGPPQVLKQSASPNPVQADPPQNQPKRARHSKPRPTSSARLTNAPKMPSVQQHTPSIPQRVEVTSFEANPRSPHISKLYLFFFSVITAALMLGVIAPTLYHQHVTDLQQSHIPSAQEAIKLDTFNGYLEAIEHLEAATRAKNVIGAQGGAFMDLCLSLFGTYDPLNTNLKAKAMLAEVYAIMSTRFHHNQRPKAERLLIELEGFESPHIVATLALLEVHNNELTQAQTRLHDAIARWPFDPNLRYLQGLVLLKADNHVSAFAQFERARQINNKFVPALHQLSRWYAARNNTRAITLWETVINDLSPDHVESMIGLAKSQIDSARDLNSAHLNLQRIITQLKPQASPLELSEAHHTLALYHQHYNRTDDAIAELKKSLDIYPENTSARLHLIEHYLLNNRLKDAEELISMTTQSELQDDLVRLNALLKLRQSKPRLAAELILRHHKEREAPAETLVLLGHIQIELKAFNKAEKSFSNALKIEPNLAQTTLVADLDMVRAIQGRADALRRLEGLLQEKENAINHWRLGLALEHQGDLNSAVHHFSRAARLDTKGTFHFHFPPSVDLCRLEVNRKHYDKAEEYCMFALRQQPNYSVAQRLIAQLDVLRGRYKEARQKLDEIIEGDGRDLDAQMLRIRSMIMLRDFKAARAAIEGLLTKHSEDNNLLAIQGLLAFHKHKYSLALGYLRRALEAHPEDSELRLHVAWCHIRLNQSSQAREHLNQVRRDTHWRGAAFIALADIDRRDEDPRAGLSKARKGLRLLQRSESEPWRISEAYTVYGRLLAQRHTIDHTSSGDLLKKATSKNDTYAPAHYFFARYARYKGQTRTFTQRLQRAVDVNPYFCPAVKRLRRENPAGATIPGTCN